MEPRHLLIHTHHLQLHPSVTAAKHLLSLTDTYTHDLQLYARVTAPRHLLTHATCNCIPVLRHQDTCSHTTCNCIPVLWHQDTCSHTRLRHQDTCSHTLTYHLQLYPSVTAPRHLLTHSHTTCNRIPVLWHQDTCSRTPLATVSQCYITKTPALAHTHHLQLYPSVTAPRHLLAHTHTHTHTQPCRPLHSLCSALKPGAQCQVWHSWLPNTAAKKSPWTGLQSPVHGRPCWTVASAPRRTQWRHWTRLVSSTLSSLARPHPAGTLNKMAQGHTQTSALQFCKRLIMSWGGGGGGGALWEHTFLSQFCHSIFLAHKNDTMLNLFITAKGAPSVTSSLAIWGWFGNNLSLTMEQQYIVSERICKQDSAGMRNQQMAPIRQQQAIQ